VGTKLGTKIQIWLCLALLRFVSTIAKHPVFIGSFCSALFGFALIER